MQLSALESNGRALEEGRWFDYRDGMRVKVAPIGSRSYDEEIQRLTRPQLRRRRAGDLEQSDLTDLSMRAAAKHVLVDWDGLEDEHGAAVEYSPEKALQLFRANYRFYRDVMGFAGEVQAEEEELEEETAKN